MIQGQYVIFPQIPCRITPNTPPTTESRTVEDDKGHEWVSTNQGSWPTTIARRRERYILQWVKTGHSVSLGDHQRCDCIPNSYRSVKEENITVGSIRVWGRESPRTATREYKSQTKLQISSTYRSWFEKGWGSFINKIKWDYRWTHDFAIAI